MVGSKSWVVNENPMVKNIKMFEEMNTIDGSRYSRTDQVKSVEDSL